MPKNDNDESRSAKGSGILLQPTLTLSLDKESSEEEQKKTIGRRSGMTRGGLRKFAERRWRRFKWERSDRKKRDHLVRELCSRVVSFTLQAPWSHRLVIETICKQAGLATDILSPQIEKAIGVRGKTVFGFAGDEIDKIARDYDRVFWWLSTRGLTLDKIPWSTPEDFDYIAGKLMFEARRNSRVGKYLTRADYLAIAGRLDAFGKFKPIELLTLSRRKELALWNQQNNRNPITTFSQAMNAIKPPWLRERIMKKLYRAEERFKKHMFPGA